MQVERLSPKEAAAYLGISVSTLARWRAGASIWRGSESGPQYVSVHGRIWYREDWLKDWEEAVWNNERIQ